MAAAAVADVRRIVTAGVVVALSFSYTMNDGKLHAFDCCVGVGLPLLTICRAFQHDRLPDHAH
jgi:hypothetical protein